MEGNIFNGTGGSDDNIYIISREENTGKSMVNFISNIKISAAELMREVGIDESALNNDGRYQLTFNVSYRWRTHLKHFPSTNKSNALLISEKGSSCVIYSSTLSSLDIYLSTRAGN